MDLLPLLLHEGLSQKLLTPEQVKEACREAREHPPAEGAVVWMMQRFPAVGPISYTGFRSRRLRCLECLTYFTGREMNLADSLCCPACQSQNIERDPAQLLNRA